MKRALSFLNSWILQKKEQFFKWDSWTQQKEASFAGLPPVKY
jgi:hypothetical protein